MIKQKKIKVLHIITRLDHGGSSTNTIDTANKVNPLNFETTLISGQTYDPANTIRNTLNSKNINITFINELRREINPLFDVIAFIKLYTLIKEGSYDIVHTHCSKAGILGRWAAKLAGTKNIIHTPHGHIFYFYFNKIKTRIFILLEQLTAKITTHIITLTTLGTEEHLHFNIAPCTKFITIPSGIDIKSFKPSKTDQDMRKRLNIAPDCFLFGSVTRFDRIKGNHILLNAFAEVIKLTQNTKLLLVGDGEERHKLENQCRQLNITDYVIFTGYQKRPADFIQIMDTFLLPSLNEGMGRAIIEAMLCKVPVIASQTGGIPDLIESNINGILVSPNNTNELTQEMIKALLSPETGEMYAENGQQKAISEYSLTLMIEKIENLYKNIMHIENKPHTTYTSNV